MYLVRTEIWNPNVLITFGFILGSIVGSIILLSLHDTALSGPDRIQWETLLAAGVAILGAGAAFASAWIPYMQKKISELEHFYHDSVIQGRGIQVDCKHLCHFGIRSQQDLARIDETLRDVRNWQMPPNGTAREIHEKQALVKLHAFNSARMLSTEETNRLSLGANALPVDLWSYAATLSELKELDEALEKFVLALKEFE